MSRRDAITGKKAMMGNTRSFSMNHSRRSFRLNLQSAKIKDGSEIKKVKVSARTLKTLKKQGRLVI
ncbi:MAG: 50S ribosomal protein L28 [Mycoplasmataceae bacterium]|jgi:large subunit ribosomal protein L28|nr:50S ribosomal protein L28 [Mycoplasmataceae bacterium]